MLLEFYLTLILFAVAGTLVGSLLSLIPSLHVYNVIGFVMLAYLPLVGIIPEFHMIMLLVGMLTGYAFMFNAQTILLNVPDDGTIFILMPGSKYLQQGRGHEAVVLVGTGCLIGIFFIVIALPISMHALVAVRHLMTQQVLFWVIGAIIFFILMSEWPKDFGRGKTRLSRLADGWSSLGAGYLAFLLSSILGIIMFSATVIPVERSFLQLGIAFIGLFAFPALILNILAETTIPKQHISKSLEVSKEELVRGGSSGCLGGLLGAFIPAVTAGVAGLIAGHATAQRGDRPFVMSMGASRVVYYVGAIVLFFLPALHLRRGWLGIAINMFFVPETMEQYLLISGAIAICGFLSFVMLLGLSRVMIKIITTYSYRKISASVMLVVIGIVYLIGSWQGLIVAAVAAAIGLIPVMFHSRRLNCLAVLLVPLWLNIGGYGPTVAGWLGV